MEGEHKDDKDRDDQSAPGIPRPGKQADQQQISGAPPQPNEDQRQRQGRFSSQWIPPTTGNPDLDPAGFDQGRRIDLREPNVSVPQGMLFDTRQLHDQQRRGMGVPPGARFDPFGPPDPDMVGPGRGPDSMQFGNPDPDHLPPPGVPQLFGSSSRSGPKSLKFPPPPGGSGNRRLP